MSDKPFHHRSGLALLVDHRLHRQHLYWMASNPDLVAPDVQRYRTWSRRYRQWLIAVRPWFRPAMNVGLLIACLAVLIWLFMLAPVQLQQLRGWLQLQYQISIAAKPIPDLTGFDSAIRGCSALAGFIIACYWIAVRWGYLLVSEERPWRPLVEALGIAGVVGCVISMLLTNGMLINSFRYPAWYATALVMNLVLHLVVFHFLSRVSLWIRSCSAAARSQTSILQRRRQPLTRKMLATNIGWLVGIVGASGLIGLSGYFLTFEILWVNLGSLPSLILPSLVTAILLPLTWRIRRSQQSFRFRYQVLLKSRLRTELLQADLIEIEDEDEPERWHADLNRFKDHIRRHQQAGLTEAILGKPYLRRLWNAKWLLTALVVHALLLCLVYWQFTVLTPETVTDRSYLAVASIDNQSLSYHGIFRDVIASLTWAAILWIEFTFLYSFLCASARPYAQRPLSPSQVLARMMKEGLGGFWLLTLASTPCLVAWWLKVGWDANGMATMALMPLLILGLRCGVVGICSAVIAELRSEDPLLIKAMNALESFDNVLLLLLGKFACGAGLFVMTIVGIASIPAITYPMAVLFKRSCEGDFVAWLGFGGIPLASGAAMMWLGNWWWQRHAGHQPLQIQK